MGVPLSVGGLELRPSESDLREGAGGRAVSHPDFKIRLFFDTEYLQNGYRYGHSYYGRRIGNRTKLSNNTTLNDLE